MEYYRPVVLRLASGHLNKMEVTTTQSGRGPGTTCTNNSLATSSAGPSGGSNSIPAEIVINTGPVNSGAASRPKVTCAHCGLQFTSLGTHIFAAHSEIYHAKREEIYNE